MMAIRALLGSNGHRTLSALILTLIAALALPALGAAHAAAAAGPVMYPNGIGADLGPSPVTLGVVARAGDDAAGLRTGTLAGKTYWQTQVAAGTTYFGVAPNTGYVASVAGRPVVLLVTYYDSGSGELSDGKTCTDDTDCVESGKACGGNVCSWKVTPHACVLAIKGDPGRCTNDSKCWCAGEGATCNATSHSCSFTTHDGSAGAGK